MNLQPFASTQGAHFCPAGSDSDNGIRASPGLVTGLTGSGSYLSNPRPVLPNFTGKDVHGWLYRAQQVMDFYNGSNNLRVRVAALYLEGGPLEWYRGNVQAKGKPLLWVEFEKGLLSMYDISKVRKVFDKIPQPLPILIRKLLDKTPQSLSRAPITNVNAITTTTSSLVQSTTPAVAITINAAPPPATAVPQCASHPLPSLPGSAVKVLDEIIDVFDNTSTLDTSNSATLHAVLDSLCNDYKMFDRMLARGNEGSDGESEDAGKMFIEVLVRGNKMEMESLGLKGLGDLILGIIISRLDLVDAASTTWTSTKLEKVVWLSLAMNPFEDYGYVTKWGFDSCTAVGNPLIVLYLKCNWIESAVQMFDEIPKRNAGSSNAIIYGLLDLASFEKAFDQVKCSVNGRSRMYIVLTDKEFFGFSNITLQRGV